MIIYEGRDGLSFGKVRKGDFWKLQPRRPVRGIFGYSDAGDGGGERTARDSRGALQLDGILPKSSCFPQNPSFFSHHFPPRRPSSRARARSSWLFPYIRTPKPYILSPLQPPARAAFLLLPIQFYAGTRLPCRAVSVICFYRHVRTNEWFVTVLFNFYSILIT